MHRLVVIQRQNSLEVTGVDRRHVGRDQRRRVVAADGGGLHRRNRVHVVGGNPARDSHRQYSREARAAEAAQRRATGDRTNPQLHPKIAIVRVHGCLLPSVEVRASPAAGCWPIPLGMGPSWGYDPGRHIERRSQSVFGARYGDLRLRS